MRENYEVIYTHPGGAVATFTRQDGELDALAKGLDAGQFWTFKNVKSLLARNDAGDLEEATRLMAAIGFSGMVRDIVTPVPALATAGAPAVAGAHAVEAGAPHIHMPGPSYWPLLLGLSVAMAFTGLLFWETTLLITAIGLILAFVAGIGWGLEPI
ncbi:MAG TPA: hypothetical protein VF808_09480 [Ktedonobacterales bacterium]